MDTHRLKFSELIRLSLRTFRVKPVRAILTIAGMSVGIGTVMFLISLGYGLQYILIGELVSTEDSLITMEVSYPSETNLFITAKDIDDLKKMEEVKEVSSVAEFPGEIKFNDLAGSVQVRAVEANYFRLSGLSPDVGTQLFEGERGVVISSQTSGLIQVGKDDQTLGKEIGLRVFYENENSGLTEEASSTSPLPIRGIITDDVAPPAAYVFREALSKEPPFYRMALVKANDIDTVEALRDKLIAKGFLVSARIDLVNQAKKIMNIITGVLGIFGITALVVSAIGMFNTMIVGFLERIYEVGILKSLGATDEDVRNLFLMESAIMGFLGGAGGVILGYSAGKSVNLVLSIVATKLGGKAFDLFITPSWFVVLTMCLSVFIGLFSGFWPARRAAGLSPKEAFAKR